MAAKKKARRVGRTKTFGVSVDAETERFLREEAAARFEGNVSRLISVLAAEERSRRAAEWLLRDSGYTMMSAEEARAFAAQFRAPLRRRKRPAA